MPQVSLDLILKSFESHSLVDPGISKSEYCALDLSVTNPALETIDLSSSSQLEQFIWEYMNNRKARVAYGGYLEQRGIYNRSTYFNQANPITERNIHLGLDLWIEANSPIFAPMAGHIHSFRNNTNYGDYGPTIILKHEIQNHEFYTLYGHLSLESLQDKRIGERIEKGEEIATLGTAEVNGDYPPHLHFQIIKDIQHYSGDYPGVSDQLNLANYQKNCPDPRLLLDLN